MWQHGRVTVNLNHTIVWCRNKEASAEYLTEVLGLGEPRPWGPFLVVQMDNGTSLDFRDYYKSDGEMDTQHYAFLVSEGEFDQILGRLCASGQQYWAEPDYTNPGEVNHNDGGRGVYFKDPDGHALEVITRPYGSGG